MREFTRRINREYGITVILTTHFVFEAEELCDRVAIMDEAKIVSYDSVVRLRKHLQQYDSYILTCGEVPEDLVMQIGAHPDVVSCTFSEGRLEISAEHLEHVLFGARQSIRERQIDVFAVETNEPTLADIFLNCLAGRTWRRFCVEIIQRTELTRVCHAFAIQSNQKEQKSKENTTLCKNPAIDTPGNL